MRLNSEHEKRREIKSAARALFMQFGFSKTSMEDIARQSGMAKPTLYYYYASKDALFDEVVLEEARQIMERIERKLPPDLPADEKLMFFFRRIYSEAQEHARRMADLPRYLCEHSPHGHPVLRKIDEMFQAKLQPVLLEGQQSGVFDIDDIAVTAQTLVFMTEFINMDWMLHYPAATRDSVNERMIEIVISGLKRRRS